MLVVVVGARAGKSLAAVDKTTGEVLWTSLSDKAGYSTPGLVEVDGVSQLVVLMGEAVVGVSAEDGREFWRHPWKTTLDANVATPIFLDDRLFISTGYGTGAGMFKLSVKDGVPAAELLWKSRNMKNNFSTCVLFDGHLYGFNDRFLTCIEFDSGDVQWRERGFNHGSLLLADGKLIIAGERGTLALAEASPEAYREISSFRVFEGKWWTVPTLAGGKLFVRNDEELVCLNLKP
jgi:outer membrane protein assembly factor BamB